MAGNENVAPNTSATKPKQAEKVTPVKGTVRLNTNTFDPRQPILMDEAADAFKAQLAETHGDKSVSNVTVTMAKHVIGHSVEYLVTGEIAE